MLLTEMVEDQKP